jgi:hypothetical protein
VSHSLCCGSCPWRPSCTGEPSCAAWHAVTSAAHYTRSSAGCEPTKHTGLPVLFRYLPEFACITPASPLSCVCLVLQACPRSLPRSVCTWGRK